MRAKVKSYFKVGCIYQLDWMWHAGRQVMKPEYGYFKILKIVSYYTDPKKASYVVSKINPWGGGPWEEEVCFGQICRGKIVKNSKMDLAQTARLLSVLHKWDNPDTSPYGF